MAQAVERCVMVEEEILNQVDRLAAKQKEVTQALERLDNPSFYKLLHLRYIQFKEFQAIADIFKVSYDAITTAHGRALKSLQDILDA